MPSLGDSAFIILLGLLLFGPKGLAQIARQLGKLMGEFRRASNEFRMQMEEELRVAEQEDRQKKIAAIEAAAPTPPALTSSMEEEVIDHPHLHATATDTVLNPAADLVTETIVPPAPIPIATSGDLSIMPPATGLPAPRTSSLAPLLDAVPHVDIPTAHVEAVHNGPADFPADHSDQKPMRYTNHHEESSAPAAEEVDTATESVHG